MIVDQQKNIVFVTYKPDTRFDAKILREAADKAGAAFVLLQIVARGRVIEEGAQHFLIAGEDRFLLIEPAAGATPLPAASETILTVVASLDDSSDPMKLKVVQAKPVE